MFDLAEFLTLFEKCPEVESRILKIYIARILKLNDYSLFPGSQPISFQASHIGDLYQDDYYVCEKSDGYRFLLFLTYDTNQTKHFGFLIDRNYVFYKIPDYALRDKDDSLHDGLLLDGEITKSNDSYKYLIFDALIYKKNSLTHLFLPNRLSVVERHVIAPYKKVPGQDDYPFGLHMKNMVKSYYIRPIFNFIKESGVHHDGLIFTKVQHPYISGTSSSMLKWKPMEENTIDFAIDHDVNKLRLSAEKISLYVAENDCLSFFGWLVFLDSEDRARFFKACPNERAIVECHYIGENNWRWNRFRPDKNQPNFKTVAMSILRSIQNSVSENDLVGAEHRIKTNWKQREQP